MRPDHELALTLHTAERGPFIFQHRRYRRLLKLELTVLILQSSHIFSHLVIKSSVEKKGTQTHKDTHAAAAGGCATSLH